MLVQEVREGCPECGLCYVLLAVGGAAAGDCEVRSNEKSVGFEAS